MSPKNTKLFAVVLLLVLTVPAIVLGLYVAPWFFLIMVGLIFIPMLFLGQKKTD